MFPLGPSRVLDQSDSKHKPAVALKSQTGVLRLLPCWDFSMHGAGENVLLGFEFVKDGKSCARLSLSEMNLSCGMLKRSIRGQHECDELQSYCK